MKLMIGIVFCICMLAGVAHTQEPSGFIVPPEKGAPRPDKVGSLRLAAHELKDVPILISAKGTELERELSEHGVVVGIAVLQNFVITFDFRRKVVILERL